MNLIGEIKFENIIFIIFLLLAVFINALRDFFSWEKKSCIENVVAILLIFWERKHRTPCIVVKKISSFPGDN